MRGESRGIHYVSQELGCVCYACPCRRGWPAHDRSVNVWNIKIAPSLPRAKIAPQPPRAFVSITNEIALSDELANHNELAIARAFLRHSVEFVLPPHYRPDVTGEMPVIGVDTKKLTKTKAVLRVEYLLKTKSGCLRDAGVT